MSIKWLEPKRGGEGRVKAGVVLRIAPTIRKMKKGKQQFTVTIYEPLMKELGIYAGDRILVGVDAPLLYFQRSPVKGFRLTPVTARDKEHRASLYGMRVTSAFKFSGDFSIASRNYTKDELTIDDKGVIQILVEAEK